MSRFHQPTVLTAVRLAVATVATAVLMSGCSGGGAPDYEHWADQITEQAHSTDITAWSITDSQLNLPVRANQADTGWSIGSSSGATTTGDETGRPSSTVPLDGIDWAAASEALAAAPEGCTFPTLQVNVLPAGQIYQRINCNGQLHAVNVTVDGQPLSYLIGEDAAAFQQFVDVVEPLMPNGQVHGIGAMLGDAVGGTSMEVSDWVVADGRAVTLSIAYLDDNAAEPLSITSSDTPNYPANPAGSDLVPTLTFRPSDYPAAAYANAITDGAARATDIPDVMTYSAISPTELAWTMMAGPVERIHGTVNR